ncbi:MAG: LLM class flavin-dependent oxidoreductase [Gammaproteobacteria bacterium]|nr:LLM class flavin-dependent oxidoreductase [Gammaproteobacteria bacterium]
MKFSIAANMQRVSPDESIEDVAQAGLDLVKLADEGGFEIAWAAEHHCLEMIIAPNPFVLLTHWAAHTKRIRLGTAVVVAPYWHPIRVAGEAGFTDLFTGGRLEIGIARGAFQYEFDRMAAGIPQQQGGEYVKEMVPVLKGLWQGDYEHDGKYWRFPKATAVPKPLQQPHPPLWVAARGPDTFQWAVEHGLNIMSTPLQKPFGEVKDLADKLQVAVDQSSGGTRPRWLVLRNTCVYQNPDDWRVPVDAAMHFSAQFQGLFTTGGTVTNGFPQEISLQGGQRPQDYTPEALWENMVFGTPEQVVEKLKQYRALGVDLYCYGANFGLPHSFARRSLELFIDEVMPHFAGESMALTDQDIMSEA